MYEPLRDRIVGRVSIEEITDYEGKLIVGALGQRDYTMLQGLMVVYTFIILFVNLLTDLTYGLIDPRVKYQ